MKNTFLSIAAAIGAFAGVYLLGILFTSYFHNSSGFDINSQLQDELGYGFRVALIVVPVSVMVKYVATSLTAIVVATFFIESLVILLGNAGYVFGSTQFLLGVPLGVVVQDLLSCMALVCLLRKSV